MRTVVDGRCSGFIYSIWTQICGQTTCIYTELIDSNILSPLFSQDNKFYLFSQAHKSFMSHLTIVIRAKFQVSLHVVSLSIQLALANLLLTVPTFLIRSK